jgi:ribonuclease R
VPLILSKIDFTMPNKQDISKEEKFLNRLKKDILEFFDFNEDLSYSLARVHKAFGLKDVAMKQIFNELILELHTEGHLLKQANGEFRYQNQTEFLSGRIEHVNARFGFLIPEDGSQDVWIDNRDLNGAIDGDSVKVLVFDKRKPNARREGEVVEITKRGHEELVGTLTIAEGRALITPDSRRIYSEIIVKQTNLNGAQNGDKVIVQITQWLQERSRYMEGRVVEVLGKAGENNTEMHAILAEFGLPIRFPKEVEEESEGISEAIPEEEIAKRRDMRNTLTFTIDPADAKDFDDALSVQYLPNGHYEIGVHIADVTHYVRPNTALEQEAFRRATSVYLVDRVVPMLPEKLSNGLCSLRPNEDKLTFSAVFEIDSQANIIKEWFGRTIIHSDKRFAYEEAQESIDNFESQENFEGTTSDKTLAETLVLLNSLAKKLREKRFNNGSVNFETVEVKFKLGADSKPLGVYQKVRKDTHKLIEEFMLLANKRVAEYVFNLRKKEPRNTMVYRVHEAPDSDRLLNFAAFAAKFGYKIDSKNISGSLNKLMAEVEGKPEQNVMESLAIRTMAKARYSTEPLGHFGLAFPFYSHFTSPIRRYPDMMAHRLLQHYLDGGSPQEKDAWEGRCKHSSDRERLANEAERASIKYKQVEYMSLLDKGQVFEGIISGVTEFGMFVEITETACEGMVRLADLSDDYYELDKENYRVIGRSKGRVFTFGDAVKVKVKTTDLSKRSMDLDLVEITSAGRIVVVSGGKNTRGDFSRKSSNKSKSNKVVPKGQRRNNNTRKRR